MTDQAEKLRQLVVTGRPQPARAERQLASSLGEDETTPQAISSHGAQTLLFTSGKGGVGTSNLVLNLAIAHAAGDDRR